MALKTLTVEQVKQYLGQFQKAENEQERADVIERYQAFLEALSTDERNEARQYMQNALRPSIEENIKELDALAEQAHLVLKEKNTYKGCGYVFPPEYGNRPRT